VLPQDPLVAIANGNAAGVRLLTGTNRHEMTLFQIADPALVHLDDAQIVEKVRTWVGDAAPDIVASYRARRPGASPQALWLDLSTDAVFRMPAIRLAEAQLPHGPAWMYLFGWESPAFGGLLRSTHALEMAFVFDNLTRGGAGMLIQGAPEAPTIADAMHRSWIAFARSGDPNHPGLPAWPRYDLARRPTMWFDASSELRDDPDREDRLAWADTLRR
jgi:para-nitrobenzyl esterase